MGGERAVEAWLREVREDGPCGPNLEYDPEFGELQRVGSGRPEQRMGDTVLPAEDPDWRRVAKVAEGLLSRTKDLRVAAWLFKASLHTHGLSGLAQGLALVRGLLERYWADVHPQLDPEDDNDPTMRINALTELCEPSTVLGQVRLTPLVEAQGLGAYSLRDIALATGEHPGAADGGTEAPSLAAVEAAFSACRIEALQVTADHLSGSLRDLGIIEKVVAEQVASARGPNFTALSSLLQQAQRFVLPRLAGRTEALAASQPAATGDDGQDESGGGMDPQPQPQPQPQQARERGPTMVGEMRSRDDVVAAIDRICSYYVRFEPSSPVPILLRRARKLIHMDFLDIVRDLAPDGISQVEMLRGREES